MRYVFIYLLQCAALEVEISKVKQEMDNKGRSMDRKTTTLNAIKQDLMKLRSEYVSLLDTEKRSQTEISKEKTEKNNLYLSLVAVEEEANKLRNALNGLETNFMYERDKVVMKYIEKRTEIRSQAFH
jgi:chromosome segregation ATPase